MPAVVAGIALPEGSPAAASEASTGLRRAAGGFERTGGITRRAVASVTSWQGFASMTFRNRCGDYGEGAEAAAGACERAAVVLVKYEHRLEEARDKVRRLQERAERCVDRIQAAERRAADAGDRAEFASRMAYQSSFGAGADAGATAAVFRQQADDARADQQAALDEAQTARDELEQLRREAEDERELVKEAGRVAAGLVQGAVVELPAVTVATPAPAAPAEQEEEEDKPWYEDTRNAVGDGATWTGGQLLGVGKGVGEGVVGIGQGGVMIYKLSAINYFVDRESSDQAWADMERTVEFAKENPGEFGKAIINWEDLSEGRYGEWAGNLAPDAALAFFTAGSGTVSTRGLRAADTVGDVSDAARTVDRLGDASRGAGRAGAAPGGAMTDAGRVAAAQGDDVVRHWTPLDGDRPLVESGRGDTFRSSTYDEVRLGQDRLFYRDYSDPNRQLGAFWTREPSLGPTQSILDSALLPEWGNRATDTVVIRVPEGSTVFEGPTAGQGGLVGGGQQTVIPKVDPDWVVTP